MRCHTQRFRDSRFRLLPVTADSARGCMPSAAAKNRARSTSRALHACSAHRVSSWQPLLTALPECLTTVTVDTKRVPGILRMLVQRSPCMRCLPSSPVHQPARSPFCACAACRAALSTSQHTSKGTGSADKGIGRGGAGNRTACTVREGLGRPRTTGAQRTRLGLQRCCQLQIPFQRVHLCAAACAKWVWASPKVSWACEPQLQFKLCPSPLRRAPCIHRAAVQ